MSFITQFVINGEVTWEYVEDVYYYGKGLIVSSHR